jgi:ribosomal protein S18 acetylase RimI-like enzyme
MGNQHSEQIYKDFSHADLRLATQTREEHFREEILRHLKHKVNRKFAVYKTDYAMGYAIVRERKDEKTGEDFVQIYGLAVHPFSYAKSVARALANFIRAEYPEHEFRGMVRAINEKGRRLYRWLGAVECDDWHDEDYDEHHLPLRIPSTVVNSALEKTDK